VGKEAEYVWRCPVCRKGIANRHELTASQQGWVRRKHRESDHPTEDPSTFYAYKVGKPAQASQACMAAARARQLLKMKQGVLAHHKAKYVALPLPGGGVANKLLCTACGRLAGLTALANAPCQALPVRYGKRAAMVEKFRRQLEEPGTSAEGKEGLRQVLQTFAAVEQAARGGNEAGGAQEGEDQQRQPPQQQRHDLQWVVWPAGPKIRFLCGRCLRLFSHNSPTACAGKVLWSGHRQGHKRELEKLLSSKVRKVRVAAERLWDEMKLGDKPSA
jgi:hypothetical protein